MQFTSQSFVFTPVFRHHSPNFLSNVRVKEKLKFHFRQKCIYSKPFKMYSMENIINNYKCIRHNTDTHLTWLSPKVMIISEKYYKQITINSLSVISLSA